MLDNLGQNQRLPFVLEEPAGDWDIVDFASHLQLDKEGEFLGDGAAVAGVVVLVAVVDGKVLAEALGKGEVLEDNVVGDFLLLFLGPLGAVIFV